VWESGLAINQHPHEKVSFSLRHGSLQIRIMANRVKESVQLGCFFNFTLCHFYASTFALINGFFVANCMA
jgi:hypothetical protein